MIGTVRIVRDNRLGAELTADTAAGETVLPVDDATEFEEEGGELFLPDGTVMVYTTADFDALTVTLEDPLAADLDEDDWIGLWSSDHEDTERTAEVDVGDGPPIVAVVPHSLRPLLKPGTRDPETAEIVDLEEYDDEVRIVTVRGREPVIEARALFVPNEEVATVSATSGGLDAAQVVAGYMIVGEGVSSYPLVVYDEPSFSAGAIAVAPQPTDGTGIWLVLGGNAAAIQFGALNTGPNTYLEKVAEGRLRIYSTLPGGTLELEARTGDPSTPDNGFVKVYAKEVAGNTVLFGMGDDGVAHALW